MGVLPSLFERRISSSRLIANALLMMDSRFYRSESIHIVYRRMFSPNTQSYYTYQGSLTTPNCEEVVTWIVMDTPIYITDEQVR